MKVVYAIGQAVDVNNRPARVAGMTDYLLDLTGNFENSNYFLGQSVVVSGLRYTVLGATSDSFHLEICGGHTIGEV